MIDAVRSELVAALRPTSVPLEARLRAIAKSRKRKKWLKRARAHAGPRK